MVCSQKQGRGQIPQRHKFPEGRRRNIVEGMEGEWKREKKNPYFHSMAVTFWGWQMVQMGHQLRKPISYRWPRWPQSCQVFGAHISPRGLILSHSVPGSEVNCSKQVSSPSPGREKAALLQLRIVSSSADFYKVLFSGKGGIREILKQ